jgi:hypothetical protein
MFYTTDAASFQLLQEVLKVLKRLGRCLCSARKLLPFRALACTIFKLPTGVGVSGRLCCLSRERDRVTLHLVPCTWCGRAPGAVHNDVVERVVVIICRVLFLDMLCDLC